MSHSKLVIQDGAYLISDAHYGVSRPELLDFLKSVHKKELHPTQMIFMGDIFDALFGGVQKTIDENKLVVDLINDISLYIEVIYLEGNHDFNLKNVFKNSTIYPISMHPVECTIGDKKLYLAHGDFVGNTTYNIYTSLIRSPIILFILNFMNALFNNFILKNLDNHLSKKNDCTNIKNFNNIISLRVENKFDCDYFVEGHFHQNKWIDFTEFKYFNLAAFACNQRYFIVELSKEELLVEKIFSKEK